MPSVNFLKAAALAALLPAVALAYASPGKPSGFVNDFAGVLSPGQKTALESKLAQFEKDTGDEIAVVIIRSLGGDTVENYAVNLFKEWGVGQKGKDNGALLLAAVEDRKLRVEVGYGLEGSLTDLQSSWIIKNQIAPEFKAGRYYEGLDAGVNSIISAVKGEAAIPSEPLPPGANQPGGAWDLRWIIVGFIFLNFLLGALRAVLGRSKSWWLGGVLGAGAGVLLGLIFGFLYVGVTAIVFLAALGTLFDYSVSKNYEKWKERGGRGRWFWGGGDSGGLGGGGGFGGFGGGRSGGGGASGGW